MRVQCGLNSSKPMEFNSIPHLFSTFVTLHTLILIYAPSFFLRIVLSPVLNSTGIILLFLLKLGANERLKQLTSLEQRFLDLVDHNQTHPESHQIQAEFDHDLGLETTMEMDSKQVDDTTPMKFLKWNMKAPLEVIYEAYEGEGEEEEDEEDGNGMNMVSSGKNVSGLERYPSLLMYYPESETDSSSDDEFNRETREDVFLKWEELIEISVDRYEKRSIEFCCIEEDNLIEIDIFPMRN